MRYVVNVLSYEGTPFPFVALVTEDIVQAIDTAKNIEGFGYHIGSGPGVTVLKMEEDVVYRKPDKVNCEFLLFVRLSSSWRDPPHEVWANQDAEAEYNRLKQRQLATA